MINSRNLIYTNILDLTLDLYGQYPLSWIITPTETSTGAIKVFQMAKQKAGGGSVKYFV